MHHIKGDFPYRKQGSLIAFEAGETVTYGLFSAQERGTLFVGPGEKVYSGMVIGQNGKAEDIELNVCKTKHLTNTRSSSADDALKLVPPKILSLEQAIEFIDQDELLEVTPKAFVSVNVFWTPETENVPHSARADRTWLLFTVEQKPFTVIRRKVA